MRNLLKAVENHQILLRQTRCGELAKPIDKNHATVSRDRENFGQWRADELIILKNAVE